jgi:hypothetical protein
MTTPYILSQARPSLIYWIQVLCGCARGSVWPRCSVRKCGSVQPCSGVRQCSTIHHGVRPCEQQCAAVCGSVRAWPCRSVWQYMRQFVSVCGSVCAAMCGITCGSVRECGGECGSAAAVGATAHVAMCGSAAVWQCAAICGNVRQCAPVYVRQCALPCVVMRPCSVGGNTAVRGNVMMAIRHMYNSATVRVELCVCGGS